MANDNIVKLSMRLSALESIIDIQADRIRRLDKRVGDIKNDINKIYEKLYK